MVVGWYHSHPGFGCWLSGVDINTQQSFEALNSRAVAVVIDPIQSVKGKVVIDAFRLISPQTIMMNQEPRQTTSNIGHLNKPSIQVSLAARSPRTGWGVVNEATPLTHAGHGPTRWHGRSRTRRRRP